MKKTMEEVAYEFIKKNGASEFNKIWKYVLAELKAQWKEEAPQQLLDDIKNRKMSELHTNLTISGTFERLTNEKYELAERLTQEEIKVIRENVKPKEDQGIEL